MISVCEKNETRQLHILGKVMKFIQNHSKLIVSLWLLNNKNGRISCENFSI